MFDTFRLFVVFRGILSAEWLINHKKCQGLPLYIPDLIRYSNILNNGDKRILMTLLTEKLRKSHYEIDCDESRNLIIKGKEMIGIVDNLLNNENPKKTKQSITQKVVEMREKINIEKGSDQCLKLEELVFEIIESFK